MTPCPGTAGCSRRLEGRQARRLPRQGTRLTAPGELQHTLQEPARLGCSQLPAGPPRHLRARASRASGHRAQEPTRGAVFWAPPDARAHAYPQSPLGSPATTETRQRARTRLTPQEQDTCGATGLGTADGTAATLWTGREGPARPCLPRTHTGPASVRRTPHPESRSAATRGRPTDNAPAAMQEPGPSVAGTCSWGPASRDTHVGLNPTGGAGQDLDGSGPVHTAGYR